MRFIIDIESTNLLQNGLDYTKMPYRLKPDYKVHCVVIRHVDSNAVKTLVGAEITKDNLKHALRKCTELIGHHIVGFDLPVLKLIDVLEYEIGYPGEPSLLFGRPITITDTLLWSKLLNADRLGGHGLEAWGKRLGNYKGDFHDWAEFSPEMLEYCIQDTAVNKSILMRLLEEQARSYGRGEYEAKRPIFNFREIENFSKQLSEMALQVKSRQDLQLAVFKSELNALRNQMNPHFLFNTLNAISTYMTVDASKASQMTEQLANLYRLTLEATKHTTISLETEGLGFGGFESLSAMKTLWWFEGKTGAEKESLSHSVSAVVISDKYSAAAQS